MTNSNSIKRHVREGFRNLGRNGWMSFASVSAVTITLLILGVFLLLAMNVNYLVSNVEKQVEIRVSLDVTADRGTAKVVESELKQIKDVGEVTFVPKEQGLKEFKASFGDNSSLFQGLEKENPLPDAFVVRATSPQKTGAVAQAIKQIKEVKKVNYAEQTASKLFAITNVIRFVIVVFILALGFTAMFLIANTIKLTIVARRKEIEIMKLVGATNSFIRGPFFVEGALMGILGAILPIILLLVGYESLITMIKKDLSLYFLDLLPLYPLAYQISFILLGIGVFIGVWGSIVSVRRFLRI
ncbi:permease-like cell division protein FtsX [Aneurinibacillus terranovensis]|uniref:permease-like cell division protein FtsX n=1 Tax=Aneurinibacillus terranovensis TaxID=278991 RepID=UPI0003F77E6F|nr:permease-like cell division protein FtsX [Aneurinibacillus terranovensis]